MTTVELRPVREPDLDVFEAAFQSEAGASQYQWFGFTVERLQATTDPANQAELICLERVGFSREGVIRRAQWRGGRWHDQVLLSLLRDEFAQVGRG